MMNPLDAIDMFRRRGGSRCVEVGRRIQTYLDDGLDPNTAHRVAEHLDACRRCGLAADDYRHIKAALAHTDTPPFETLERLRRFATELATSHPGRE